MSGRRAGRPRGAAAATAVLLGLLGVALAVLVPWTPLPGARPKASVGSDFTPAQVAREVAFHDALRPPAYANLALGLLALAVLGLTPLGARLVGRLGRWWWLQVVLAVLAVTVLGRLVGLPLAARGELVLREFGLSTQTWGAWAVDLVKGVGVDTALTSLALLAVVGLARRLPRTWWAWAAAATAALVVAGSYAYPLVVEPVFNDVTSLAPGPLRQDLLALAARSGVPVDDVLVADASRRTTTLNAYVSGFGASRRLVVYDTLLASAPAAEVEVIVAHELGHAGDQDVRNGTLLGALGAAAAVCALSLLLGWAPLLRRAGVSGVGDPRVVPLLLLLVGLGTQLVGPAGNLVSRRVEARADVSALDLTRDPTTFVDVQRRLSVANLSDLDPNPLAQLLYATHPSTPERIALAREWARLRR